MTPLHVALIVVASLLARAPDVDSTIILSPGAVSSTRMEDGEKVVGTTHEPGTREMEGRVGEILEQTRHLTKQVEGLQQTADSLKYQNHLIYKQLKKMAKLRLHTDTADSVPVKAMQADMAIVTPTQPRCPDEFTYSDKTKSCYLFGTDRISWRMARERCQVLGTDLVAIETGKEQKAIMDLARQEPDTRHCDFWTSGTDRQKEGEWRWLSTGETLAYHNWNIGEPNNGSHDEHCLNLMWVFNWAWNDARCNADNACYICETSP